MTATAFPSLTEPVYYTVAEVVAMWPRESDGSPRGSLAVEQLHAAGFLRAPDYREFGRRLLAARLANLDPVDATSLSGRLAAALEIMVEAEHALLVTRHDTDSRKGVLFWKDVDVAELELVDHGFGIRVSQVSAPIVHAVREYAHDGPDGVLFEVHSRGGGYRAAAWGRGEGRLPAPNGSTWLSAGDVPAAAAESWLIEQLTNPKADG